VFFVLPVPKRACGRPIQRLSELSESGKLCWPDKMMSCASKVFVPTGFYCRQRITDRMKTKLQTLSWCLHNFRQVKAVEHEIRRFHNRVGEDSGFVGCYGLSSGKQKGRFDVAWCLHLQPTPCNIAEDLSVRLAEESVGQARDTKWCTCVLQKWTDSQTVISTWQHDLPVQLSV